MLGDVGRILGEDIPGDLIDGIVAALFAQGVVDGGEDDLCPATDSRAALELILAIYKSAADGKPVQLPLKNVSTTDFTGRFDA